MAGKARGNRRKPSGLSSGFVGELVRKYSLKKSKEGYEYSPARLVEGAQRWYIEFMIWDVQQEKLVRKRVGIGRAKSDAERRRIAQAKVAQINAALEVGMVIDESAQEENGKTRKKAPKVRVGEALTQMAEIKASTGGDRTRQAYDSFIRIFETWAKPAKIWNLPIEDFQRKHVHAFLDYLLSERGVGNKSHNNYLGFLKALLNGLVSREILAKSPARGIKMLKTKSESHTVYTPPQQEAMEAWMRANHPNLYLFTRFIYYGFLRPTELLRLKVGQIDLRNRLIMITADQSKNAKQQPIYIVDPLYEILLEERIDRYHPTEFLFSKQLEPGTTAYHRNRATDLHRKALEATGLYDGKLTLYSWKHTGVCNAYRAGVDIKTLQGLLRHHSLDMTAVYLRALGLRVDENLKGKRW